MMNALTIGDRESVRTFNGYWTIIIFADWSIDDDYRWGYQIMYGPATMERVGYYCGASYALIDARRRTHWLSDHAAGKLIPLPAGKPC